MRRRYLVQPSLDGEWVAARDKLALARAMRKAPTESERLLWRALRGRQLRYRFRRQHILGGYIVDFYCAQARVAVELDGAIHQRQRAYDRQRDLDLAKLGVFVLRIEVADTSFDLDAIVQKIVEACGSRAPLPPLAGEGAGGWGSVRGSASGEDDGGRGSV